MSGAGSPPAFDPPKTSMDAWAFLVGHATHPDWRMALAMAAAQLDAQAGARPQGAAAPTLGLVYFTDHYAAQAQALHLALSQRWPDVRWAGCAAVGVAASGVEYFDEPALVVMLCPLAPGSFEVYSGTRPLGAAGGSSAAHTALVHADPGTTDLTELVAELSERVATGYLFGGLVSSRAGALQMAQGVFDGGLSGVAFGPGVALVSRVTQGCQPVGPERVITAADGPLVLTLDGRPALPCLLQDLGITLDDPRKAMPVLRATLVGLTDADAALLGRGGQFGPDVRARHLIGLDPARQAVAVAERVEPGMRLAFSQRHTEAARRDLVRICSEIRDEVESDAESGTGGGTARRILGAIYVSCNGRGGPHFGAPSAELKIVQRALGDVPLAGFFAAGEIARRHLYGYTGVLTVFTSC
jgi:small ligand-binding sensory domain FIST